jgi:polar amino acid transport system substrate-binding protein
MKRLTLATVVFACAAAALAAFGGAATRDAAAPATAASPSAVERARLPALPSNIRRRGRFVIGVKCDAPPFGYINVRGENAGFDVEIARWFSRYAFGRPNRVGFECTPTPAREPALTSGRVDMVIATFTYTRDRDTRIDFSRAYYKATGRLLVKNDQPNTLIEQLSSRNIVTTSGSIYDRWVRRCFPNARLTVTDNFTNAALTFNQGRADTLMWDDTVLVGIAAADRTSKLTTDTFLALPYGIGMRQGNTALVRWVNARLELMRRADRFMTLLRNNVPARFVAGFSNNILRPRNTFGYAPATAPAPDTVCP